MKKLFPIPALCLALCLQAACVPLPIHSEITACPAEGLSSVVFTTGRPPGGTDIPVTVGEDGAQLWDVSGAKGEVYLTCHYTDGTKRLQRLPGAMSTCMLTSRGNLSCKSYI